MGVIEGLEKKYERGREEGDGEGCKGMKEELIEMYNKAIIYYSAVSNDRHKEFLEKLKKLF
jgi:hypothetical protein